MANSSESLVQIHQREGAGTLTLNRPRALNAFSIELAQQFIAAMDALGSDDNVKAIFVRGAGKVFSAGGDVREMSQNITGEGDPAAYFRAPLESFNRMVLAVRAMPKPVIAAVHGAVAGVAFNLVLACDLRIAEQGTRFLQAFVKLGLSPDGGGTYFLPRAVGLARACELTMLPTEIDAQTALAWGLVNWVVPTGGLDDKVGELADQLRGGPSLAIARTKALLNASGEATLAEQLAAERRAQLDNGATADFAEGIAAFVQKRPPAFHGR